MQPLVIDAPLIKAYFQEDQGLGATACTGPMTPIIKLLGAASPAYVDDTGKIESEWRGVVEPEWFVAWFSDALDSGAVEMITMDPKRELIKTFEANYGFPRGSGDRWYIFTSCAVVSELKCRTVLLSEDLDFYEPTEKQCNSQRRVKLLSEQAGRVARHLRKKEDIDVRPIVVQLALAA